MQERAQIVQAPALPRRLIEHPRLSERKLFFPAQIVDRKPRERDRQRLR
jgi:hypothetical protein